MQLDLSNEWTVWDDTESVVLKSTNGLTLTVPTVLVRALSQKELAASRGVYVPQDRLVLVPNALLAAGFVPAPRYEISGADQVAWTVLSVDGQCRDASGYQVWACTCRNFVLTEDLRDTIDIQRATITYDAAGAAVKAWPEDGAGSTLYPNLACRVQPLTLEQAEERGIRAFKTAFAVIVASQVPQLTLEDRIKWTSGTQVKYLSIAGVHNPERVDELPVLDCFLPP